MNSLTIGLSCFLDNKFVIHSDALSLLGYPKQGLRRELLCSHGNNFYKDMLLGLKENLIGMRSFSASQIM